MGPKPNSGKKTPFRPKKGDVKGTSKKGEVKSSPKKSVASTQSGIRLNKYIANSGVCSRREADLYIATGQVTVNGKVVDQMGHRVQLEDDVRFDGRRINPEAKAYVLLNKPKGFATTTSEEKSNTVMDLVANSTRSRIEPIGRLGRNATGLLLFTNDVDVMQKFTNSSKAPARLFHIELNKNLKAEDLRHIREGLKISGKEVLVEDIAYVKDAPKKEVGLKIKHTGNSVIRSIFEHLNYQVVKVDCVTIGSLTKKDLPRGRWRTLTEQEVANLKML